MHFKDHFSGHSSQYALYRPKYPGELFHYLASLVDERQTAWDCGTGNGQAAVNLSHYFKNVIATDASRNQIAHAGKKDNIDYRVCPAEKTTIEANSIDLITVAQAIHWFDFEKFYQEVTRVAKKNAVIAAWTYGLFSVEEEPIDKVINYFYHDVIKPYWPEERKYVEGQYRTIPFPFKKLKSPPFSITGKYTLSDLHQYMLTWSGVQKYIQQNGRDPFEIIEENLSKFWQGPRNVTWPLYLLVGKVN